MEKGLPQASEAERPTKVTGEMKTLSLSQVDAPTLAEFDVSDLTGLRHSCLFKQRSTGYLHLLSIFVSQSYQILATAPCHFQKEVPTVAWQPCSQATLDCVCKSIASLLRS